MLFRTDLVHRSTHTNAGQRNSQSFPESRFVWFCGFHADHQLVSHGMKQNSRKTSSHKEASKTRASQQWISAMANHLTNPDRSPLASRKVWSRQWYRRLAEPNVRQLYVEPYVPALSNNCIFAEPEVTRGESLRSEADFQANKWVSQSALLQNNKRAAVLLQSILSTVLKIQASPIYTFYRVLEPTSVVTSTYSMMRGRGTC